MRTEPGTTSSTPRLQDMPAIPPELFRSGMRKLLSGVSLVTTTHEGLPYGLIVTSVSSYAAEPPSLLVCVNRNTSAHDPILHSGILCVNFLSAAQADLVEKFSRSELRPQRFSGDDWHAGCNGLPRFGNSLATFECEIIDSIPRFTHTIFIAAIKGAQIGGSAKPMAYFDGLCA